MPIVPRQGQHMRSSLPIFAWMTRFGLVAWISRRSIMLIDFFPHICKLNKYGKFTHPMCLSKGNNLSIESVFCSSEEVPVLPDGQGDVAGIAARLSVAGTQSCTVILLNIRIY